MRPLNDISNLIPLGNLRPEPVRRDYAEFLGVLLDAYRQTAETKGAERHGSVTTRFDNQPISTELRYQGHPGFAIGQARKKLLESLRLPPARAYEEILGAIVYAVAAALWFKQRADEEPPQGEK